MELTKQELLEILERCNSATPGPWISFVEGRDHTSGSNVIRTDMDVIELDGAAKVKDQDFIAAAKQDIPALVEMIMKLKGWS
jgi:hypothetical protein